MKPVISIFWHRRDLRLRDNTGLYHALKNSDQVLPLFIFDTTILDDLENKSDARVTFIHQHLGILKTEYEKQGGSMLIKIGRPLEIFQALMRAYTIEAVYTNADYEPYALKRDQEIKELLHQHGISFHSLKDHVIFEKNEIVKKDGTPYTIFTPYMRAWKIRYKEQAPESHSSEKLLHKLFPQKPSALPTLGDIGFKVTNQDLPSALVPEKTIRQYALQRDFPAINGTSRLGIHFRFGTISIREKTKRAAQLNETFLNELIWREFYQMIIFHFPDSSINAFKPRYDNIQWENNEASFEKWCKGETGYPLVDAGMRELNTTGYMHNRVRMVVASFLSKHLLIDWRWGEAYFAEKLLDYELASNVGGWQWAAGCGCDAAPYFRVFNPLLQANKFDPDFVYIKRWVPEYGSELYPKPMIDHTYARNRAIATYKKALS